MAGDTGGGQCKEHVGLVALSAGEASMTAGQGERGIVAEIRWSPADWNVALLAIARPVLSDVIRRERAPQILSMAPGAGCICAGKVRGLRTRMTRETCGRCVRAD